MILKQLILSSKTSLKTKLNFVNYMTCVLNLIRLTQDITSRAIKEFENGDRSASAEGMMADLAALYLYHASENPLT